MVKVRERKEISLETKQRASGLRAGRQQQPSLKSGKSTRHQEKKSGCTFKKKRRKEKILFKWKVCQEYRHDTVKAAKD